MINFIRFALNLFLRKWCLFYLSRQKRKKIHENRQKIRPKQILSQNPLKDAEAFKPFEQNVKKYTVVGSVEKNIFSKLIHNIFSKTVTSK